MRTVRIWIIGLGAVGRWLLHALEQHTEPITVRYGFRPVVVGVANARDGFVFDPRGLHMRSVLARLASGFPLGEEPRVRHWPTALDGIDATDADVLVEATPSPPPGGEPGFSHIRTALQRGVAVATSNKWPVALHGVELAALARTHRTALRAESTVMSGTPVLSTLTEGLAGSKPIALRGILNATNNFILSAMAAGTPYQTALSEAQRIGLSERDPTADVEGHDETAKAMILAALVFGEQLAVHDVDRRGITSTTETDASRAAADGMRIRSVTTLRLRTPNGSTGLDARVEPRLLPPHDELTLIEGTTNAIVHQADPVGRITITGPGAGPEIAGLGILSDLIAIGRT